MVYKFDDYVFEKKLEFFLLSIDENATIESFKERVVNFLRNNVSNKQQAKEFLLRTAEKLKLKRSLIIFLVSTVLSFNLLTKFEILNVFREGGDRSVYELVYKEFKGENEMDKFLDHLAHRESSGRYHIVKSDPSGTHVYLGAFQLSKIALKDIGVQVDVNKFKKDPSVFPPEKQKEAVTQYLKKNEQYLKNYFGYIGKTINGIEVTKSGLLAAAHLVGQGKVKKFLSTNGEKDPRDGNGVRCSTYMSEFAGYNID